MAFKGTWNRGDSAAGSNSGGDRRYPSSSDSYQQFGLGPQSVSNNQMGLGPMNYQNNLNNMFPVMNSGQSLMTTTNYSSIKTTPYNGTISNMYRDFGVIDNEISFKLNSVSGPMPRVGDRVVCQMKTAEGFGTQTPYKYYGFDVRLSQSSGESRRPPRPTGSQSMNRNSDSYVNRNPNRNQSSNPKRSLPNPNNHNNNDHHSNQSSFNNNNHRDRHRPSPTRRSQSRTRKTIPPKRNSQAPPPKYVCSLPKGNLDCSEFNVIQIRTRYNRLHIPSDFYHASYKWHQTIPLDRPLKLLTPCSFHIFNKNVPHLSDKQESILDPPDGDYVWNVRVMLMSSPDIQTLINRSCLINVDPTKKSSINLDDLEQPSKLIKFLVGVRHQNEYFPLGGCWSESLDGPNPDSDPQVLIRTAIRCVHGQTGIDLSKCLNWCRYLEVRYHRREEIHKGRLIESRVENVVVFLPDFAAVCMPSSLEWEETVAKYKQTCDEEIAEELNEVTIPDEEMENKSATHHSKINLENLRVLDLKIELKARGQPVTGLKIDLKKRLAKILQDEKTEEETSTKSSEEQTTETKENSTHDVEKIRQEIESKYQLPSQRSILVHPTSSKGEKFDCRVVSLHYLLNYANKDTIKEKCFELYLFSEAFAEMLSRDYSYKIYRSLYSCLEVTETNCEVEESTNPTTNDEISLQESSSINDEDETGKKRKRSTSKDDDSSQRKKSNVEENSSTEIEKRSKTIDPELLLAFTYFDRNHCGYLLEKDLEDLLLLSGLSLTKNEAKTLVTRVAHHEKVSYQKLTDKFFPLDENSSSEPMEISQSDIDSAAPKGNLLFLPENLSIFGISSNEEKNNLIASIDNDRAMKQLEQSNKIQTALELKIETMRKENEKLIEDLHSTRKNQQTTNEQLNETKKRLRDTQHDLKEIEEKYKKYSDSLYRVRSESRSMFDHLSHVLGIKEKSTTQIKKSEDESKKLSNENEKKKEESINTTEDNSSKETIVNEEETR